MNTTLKVVSFDINRAKITHADGFSAMGTEDDLLALINLIYEASVDSTLWPTALISLADTTGTTQVSVAAMDRRAQTYDSLSPRTDPVMRASYKNYWAFHNPFRLLTAQVPAGEVFSLERIISREEFSATPVFNEWFRPAEFGLAILAVNLGVRDEVSTLLCVANAPKNDHITGKQTLAFKAALPHIDRAVRIHRELRVGDLDHDTAPERLECLQRSVMLVDGAARVLFANAAARTLLGSGGGLTLKAGCLHSTDSADAAMRFRRRNFDSSRPAPSTPACDGDAVAVKGHRCGTSLARPEHSRGHCHRRRSGQRKKDELSGRHVNRRSDPTMAFIRSSSTGV